MNAHRAYLAAQTPIYPPTFYVVHAVFSGPAFRAPTWGALLDGPGDRIDAMEAVRGHFTQGLRGLTALDAEDISPEVLRVWRCEGSRMEDVTEDFIAAMWTEAMEGVE